MKNNHINLVFKIIRKKNIFNILFIACIAFATILPIMLYGTSQSLINEVYEQNAKVYGKFTDIYYVDSKEQEIKESDVSSIIKDYNSNEFGAIYSLEKTQINEEIVNLGFMDEKAVELSGLNIIEGSYLRNTNEIILSFTLKNNLSKVAVGETITVGNEQYKIVGFYDDIGTLWPKGQKQKNSNFEQINAVISAEKAKEIYSKESIVYAQILFNTDNYTSNKVENDGSHYKNINSKVNENAVFKIPNEFLLIIYISTIIVLYNILNLSKNRIIKRFNIYNILGMEKKYIRKIYFLEYFTLGIFGITVGFVFGILINFGIIGLLNYLYNSELKIYFGKIYFWITLMILSSILINIFLFYILQFNKKGRGKFKNRKNNKYKRTNIIRLIFLEYKSNLSVVFSMTLLVIISFVIMEYGLIYKKTFLEETDYEEVEGKMSHDFDFEFIALPKDLGVGKEDTIFIKDNYENIGVDEETVEKISKEKVFKKVKIYKEYNNLWILADENKVDSYLDASDFTIDKEYTQHIERDNTIFDLFNYNNLLPVQTRMVGYSDEELKDFEKFVGYGKINIEKVKMGEEIILMAPQFTLSTQENGGILKSNIEFGQIISDKNSYKDSNFKVGDEITISTLVSKSGDIEKVNAKNAKNKLYRIDKEIKIGAIIPYYVGWWENEVTVGESYYLLTSNNAFKQIGFDATFSRIDIYKDEKVDDKTTENTINKYASELPNMYLDSRTERLNNYHKLNVMINLFVNGIIVFVALIVFTTISTQMLAKIRLNMYKYSLLRLNGMSLKKLFLIWIAQVGFLGVISFVISWLTITAISEKSELLMYGNITDFISYKEFTLIFVFIMAILGLTIIPSILYLKRSSLREGL